MSTTDPMAELRAAAREAAQQYTDAVITFAGQLTKLTDRVTELEPFVRECAESWPCDYGDDGEHSWSCRTCMAQELLGIIK